MKRTSEHQITKDEVDVGTDDADEDEQGSSAGVGGAGFQRASESVLAGRRIVKARRSAAHEPQPTAPADAAPANPSPFASALSQQQPTSTPSVDGKEVGTDATGSAAEASAGGAAPSPFAAFGAKLAEGNGGGATTAFTFGSLASAAETKPFNFSVPTFNFGAAATPAAAGSSLFGSTVSGSGGASAFAGAAGAGGYADDEDPQKEISTGPLAPTLPEQEVKTGEEDEHEMFRARAKLYHLDNAAWKERGVGMCKVNRKEEDSSKARILMRVDGSMRVVLNFSLHPSFEPDPASEKSVRFIATDLDAGGKLSSFLLKFGLKEDLSKFISAVNDCKKAASAGPSSSPPDAPTVDAQPAVTTPEPAEKRDDESKVDTSAKSTELPQEATGERAEAEDGSAEKES
eukprot:CAMPEP_0185842500 /NCGR_PEP_ID=MMETSP1353-20130828/18440_1 /TAXON_ID=1077150 /ORGANISM="Erythrolobus australicus, Strain CCMP3124" /LENGTH=401 /DNA_ID=CAMNT_0028542003 /DNA_START=18 /DNA_END=1223 /DNA_ORIENTATION=+